MGMTGGQIDEDDCIEENYTLNDFHADPKIPHPTILLVGKRFSGKSTTSVAIARQFDAHRWAAWCGTKDTEDYWAERFGSSATVWGPDEVGKVALLRIIQYQERKVRLYKKILKKPFPAKYTIGLVFDDVTSKRQFRRGEILEDLFSNGRHYKAVIIISCQYIKQLPPAVRTNTDYLFMLHNTKRTCRILYEEYVENPDEFTMFLELLRTVTSQTDASGKDMYNSLVYNGCIKTYKLDEMFQVYRHTQDFNAETVDLGEKGWREYNAKFYKDQEWEEEKRLYRKRKRIKRLQEYRDKQLQRKQTGLPGVPYDLDYFSESEESDETDKYKIKSKQGKSFNLFMPNKLRTEDEDSQHTMQSRREYHQFAETAQQPQVSHQSQSEFGFHNNVPNLNSYNNHNYSELGRTNTFTQPDPIRMYTPKFYQGTPQNSSTPKLNISDLL
jgi:hypothetical protein